MSRFDADTKFARLKWRRAFDNWERKAARWAELVKAGFDRNQPRVPAGRPGGGQWTSGGGGGTGRTDRRIVSDVTPDDLQKPGTQLAQARGPGFRQIIIGGRPQILSRGQQAQLTAVQARALAARKRVKELDRGWKPPASARSAPSTFRGLIREFEGEARAAEARLRELARQGLGPGPFAKESIPARGPGRNFRVNERQELNRMGNRDGCHTCGSRDAGTPSGNFVPDHQLPNALNPAGRAQRLYPQCLTCSNRQGGLIGSRKRKR